MANQGKPNSFHILAPFFLFVLCALAQGACSCGPDVAPPPTGVIECVAQHEILPTASPFEPVVKTTGVYAIPGSFSVTSSGEATYVMPLQAPPARAMAPQLAIRFDSSGYDGVLGAGFSITGLPGAITRCPSSLAQDRAAWPRTVKSARSGGTASTSCASIRGAWSS